MSTAKKPSAPTRSPLTFGDLVADLVWPKLFRAAGLCLNPARIGVAFFTLVAVSFVWAAVSWLETKLGLGGSAESQTTLAGIIRDLMPDAWRHDPALQTSLLGTLFISLPVACLRAHPLACFIAGPVGFGIGLVGAAAICRMAATEMAMGIEVSWPEAVGFAIGRLKSLAGAVLLPILLIWGIGVLLALGGLVLMRFPVINLLGGLLYGLFLIAAFLAVIAMLTYLLGHGLLIPAVACEGTDAIDAVQRSYAYVLGRPVRLIAYLALIWVQAIVVIWLAWFISTAVIDFAAQVTGAWAGDSGSQMLAQGTQAATTIPEARTGSWPAGTFGWGAALIEFWTLIPVTLVWAVAISFSYCASTVLYLALRRVNDGQDMSELWMPGMVEGTMAQSQRGGAGVPAPSPSRRPQGAAPDEVEIDGGGEGRRND